jgi:hypothetical protein
MQALLACKSSNDGRRVHCISTDEVFGSLGLDDHAFTEMTQPEVSLSGKKGRECLPRALPSTLASLQAALTSAVWTGDQHFAKEATTDATIFTTFPIIERYIRSGVWRMEESERLAALVRQSG